MTPEEGIRRVFDAFRGGDPRALFDVIAPDAVWIVNGTVPVAQEYAGRERVFELFRETRRLTDGTYLSTLKLAARRRSSTRSPSTARRAAASAASSTSTRCC